MPIYATESKTTSPTIETSYQYKRGAVHTVKATTFISHEYSKFLKIKEMNKN